MLRKALHPLLAALAWAFVALSIFVPVSLVLQPHMIGEAWQASLAMGLPGPSLMSPSPSGPPQRKAIILGALPQQPA